MPAQQGQTDEILKVTLTSRILGAYWADDGAAAGGKAAYEVKTQYVGDGAPIKVTFKDLEGKTLSTVEGSVLSNLHRGLFTASAANATDGVIFEAELPKHGLKVAGGRLKTGKPIQFSALRFTDPEGKQALDELPEGKSAACEAKVKGLQDGDKVLVSVHLRTDCVMRDGHLFVEGEVPVKDGKVVLLFTPKVKTRLDAIRVQAELDKEGGTYFQPEYIFVCRARGVRVVSEPAKAVQEVTINFWEFPGQAGSLEGKRVLITGPDGKKETKTIPKNGTIVIPKGKPGRVSVKGEKGISLKAGAGKQTPREKSFDDSVLTWEQLKKCSNASDALVNKYIYALSREMKAGGIISPLRKCHFLAQILHESGGLQYSVEKPSKKKKKPLLPAGIQYEFAKHLGNTKKGDGSRFKGRGLIQLTGRANYTSFAKYCGEDLLTGDNPDKVAQAEYSVKSAVWFWSAFKKLDSWADKNEFLQVTYRVNGGFNGIGDRLERLALAFKVFDLPRTIKPFLDEIDTKVNKVESLVDKENPKAKTTPGVLKETLETLTTKKKILGLESMLFLALPGKDKAAEFRKAHEKLQ